MKRVMNVPEIRSNIREKHAKFVSDLGMILDKVANDENYKLVRIVEQVKLVLQCFKDEGIIDDIRVSDGDYKSVVFLLGKIGYINHVYVEVFTDMIEVHMGNNTTRTIIEDNMDISDVNWIEFSNGLLSDIHLNIYGRQKSYETKIFKDIN